MTESETYDVVLLVEQPFLEGINQTYVDLMAGCGKNQRFDVGAYLGREGEPADTFYLIREGRVVVETNVPGRGPVPLETLHRGEIVGWSWLFPPHKWAFDIRALDLTRAIGEAEAFARAAEAEDRDDAQVALVDARETLAILDTLAAEEAADGDTLETFSADSTAPAIMSWRSSVRFPPLRTARRWR